MDFKELKTQEKLATVKALDTLNLYGETNFANSVEEISKLFDNDTITINTCRSGRDVVWYNDNDGKNCCIYIDTLEELNEQNITEELL